MALENLWLAMIVGVLVFIVLVLVAAACNIVAGLVGLGIAPPFPSSHWFLVDKNYVSNLVLWILVVVILSEVVCIWKKRWLRLEDTPAGFRTQGGTIACRPLDDWPVEIPVEYLQLIEERWGQWLCRCTNCELRAGAARDSPDFWQDAA